MKQYLCVPFFHLTIFTGFAYLYLSYFSKSFAYGTIIIYIQHLYDDRRPQNSPEIYPSRLLAELHNNNPFQTTFSSPMLKRVRFLEDHKLCTLAFSIRNLDEIKGQETNETKQETKARYFEGKKERT